MVLKRDKIAFQDNVMASFVMEFPWTLNLPISFLVCSLHWPDILENSFTECALSFPKPLLAYLFPPSTQLSWCFTAQQTHHLPRTPSQAPSSPPKTGCRAALQHTSSPPQRAFQRRPAPPPPNKPPTSPPGSSMGSLGICELFPGSKGRESNSSDHTQP